MAELVAIAVGGSAFVSELTRAWEQGLAIAPIDPRLPLPARAAVLDVLRPSTLVDVEGTHRLDGSIPVSDGDAVVIATSGTTGTPKAVVLTHDAVKASAAASNRRLAVDADAHWLACLPLAHVGGLSVITRAVAARCRLTVHDHFDAAAVESSGASHVSLVPTTLGRVRADRFERILLGGAPPPTVLPPNVVTSYGLTETGSGVVYDGRPLAGIEIVLRDGRIALRGPMLLRCYRSPIGETDPRAADGFLVTGDLGSFDDDGRLVVHGRADDLIITGGENVWPDPVERVIATIDEVAEVGVAGRPDPEWGQRVVAWIVPTEGMDPPTLDTVRGVVRAQLPTHCAPKELRLVTRLPRTALGKLQRALLD